MYIAPLSVLIAFLKAISQMQNYCLSNKLPSCASEILPL